MTSRDERGDSGCAKGSSEPASFSAIRSLSVSLGSEAKKFSRRLAGEDVAQRNISAAMDAISATSLRARVDLPLTHGSLRRLGQGGRAIDGA